MFLRTLHTYVDVVFASGAIRVGYHGGSCLPICPEARIFGLCLKLWTQTIRDNKKRVTKLSISLLFQVLPYIGQPTDVKLLLRFISFTWKITQTDSTGQFQ